MTGVSEMIERQREATISGAWRDVLDTDAGRLVVWSILERCGIFQITTSGSPLDGWRAGFRDAGLAILAERVFPHDTRTFAAMQLEHAEMMQRIQLHAEREAEKDDDDV